MDQNGEANPKSPVGVWQTEFTKLRVPNLYDLLADPFEHATESIYYADWQVHRVFIQVPIQVLVGKGLESFKEFSPRAKAASFTVGDVMEQIEANAASAGRKSQHKIPRPDSHERERLTAMAITRLQRYRLATIAWKLKPEVLELRSLST